MGGPPSAGGCKTGRRPLGRDHEQCTLPRSRRCTRASRRSFYGGPGRVVFIGRISPEKGPARAIEIARPAGLPPIIATEVDKVTVDYYKACVGPLLDIR